MLWNTFSQCKENITNQYKVECSEENARLRLEKGCEEICRQMTDEPKSLVKAHVFAYILQNAPVEVHPDDLFADRIHHFDIIGCLRRKWQKEVESTLMYDTVAKNQSARNRHAYTAEADFSHTCPDWERILNLGVSGILQEIEKLAKQNEKSAEKTVFYKSCSVVYNAVIVYMNRLADRAREIGSEKSLFLADSLDNLTKRPPQTMYEAMELTFIFYYLQTFVENVNVRSLGKIDRLYERFYLNDLKNNTFTKDNIREMIRFFFYRFYAIGAIANSPFYLCGTDKDNKVFINELSYMFLEEYIKLNINDPKIHIGYSPCLDKEYIKIAMNAIVSGRNSILFMNDEVSVNALNKLGIDYIDAYDYVPVGCYEPCIMGKEVPCTCAGRVNIPKAVEIALGNGYDLETGELIGVEADYEINSFDTFFKLIKEELKFFVSRVMKQINEYEKNFMLINPAPLFSGAMEDCVKNGADAYSGGAKYNNSSINAFGLASAVDAIVAVKKMVFDEKIITLNQLVEILKNNWAQNEKLRLKCKNLYPKYGNNDSDTDSIMTKLIEYIGSIINGKPNGRKGVYRCGFYSIDWYTDFGKTTSALPDGRLSGTPLSKNMNAVTGCDKGGVTSLINSITKIDYKDIPNGTVLDLMLHTSVASGNDGIQAMLGILETYMKKGGMALQINVFNPELLKKAQADPEKYSSLQVRLCGWNVYFVDLSKAEQDEFINMSLHTQEVQL